VLDELRRHLARKLDLVDPSAHSWAWVTEFPLFDWDPAAAAAWWRHTIHSPCLTPRMFRSFCSPPPRPMERSARALGWALFQTGLRSRAYDAVYNGNELASGSVRIHDPELQRRIFRALGLGPEQVREKFGFLLEAFRFGAPPHAGFAFGFDRLVMLMARSASLRDVIAFPKTTAGRALFEGAPSRVEDDELAELHIKVISMENQ
jgi:aspartyl-tRNA synthetase